MPKFDRGSLMGELRTLIYAGELGDTCLWLKKLAFQMKEGTPEEVSGEEQVRMLRSHSCIGCAMLDHPKASCPITWSNVRNRYRVQREKGQASGAANRALAQIEDRLRSLGVFSPKATQLTFWPEEEK